jgi:hypothetical protein
MATGLEQQLIKGARFAAGPVVPIGSIAAAGFEKGQKVIKDIEAKQFEQRKLEAENYNKKRKDSEKILSDYIKNQKTLENPLPPNNYGQIIAEGGLKLKQFRNNVENEIRNGNIGRADSMKATQEGQQMLGSLSSGVGSYGEWMEIYGDIDDNLSSTVGSTNINIVNSMAKGLVYEQGKDTVVKDEEGKTLYTFKDKNILDVYSPETFDELGYTSPDTTGINTLFDATQKSAQSAASKGADMTGYIKKVEQDLAQLTLTDNQYISAAFDFLGKETPGFTNPFDSYIEEDMRAAFKSKDPSLIKDKGGEEGNVDEIKAFVHKAMIEGAKDAYEGYKKDYADKFEPSGVKTDKKELQRAKQLESTMPLIEQVKIPKNDKGNADINNVSFTRELARLNLAVDKSGAFGEDDKVIEVRSNITNKKLNITSNMLDSDIKNILMLLSGATTQEANESYPLDREGPLSEKASDVFTPPHLRK